jgi:hypothetical protein
MLERSADQLMKKDAFLNQLPNQLPTRLASYFPVRVMTDYGTRQLGARRAESTGPSEAAAAGAIIFSYCARRKVAH